MMDYLWKALLCEFLGTFTLVFVGAGAVALTAAQGGSLVGSAFAFGLALMILIYAWGSYSGAHFNPAISFGTAVAGRMNWGLMFGYWIAQLLGGIAAAALIAYFFGTASGVGASIGSLTNTDAWRAVLFEAIITFFLVITFLLVTKNPWMAFSGGIAIGLVLTANMLFGAPLTGASMNPARSLGPAIFSGNIGTYWIYVVGPLIGALVAALIYKLFTTDFTCCIKRDACGKPITDKCGNVFKECKRQVVDECGKPVVDCNGPVYETYVTREQKLNHMQSTPLMAIAEYMSSHGFDPRYLKQEFSHKAEEILQKKDAIESMLGHKIKKPHHHHHHAEDDIKLVAVEEVAPCRVVSPRMNNQNTYYQAAQSPRRGFQSPGQMLASGVETVDNGFAEAFSGGLKLPGQLLASNF